MAATQAVPPLRFVNLQPSTVTVFDENKRNVGVGPFHLRHQQGAGVYVLEGTHWAMFKAPYGPLSVYPDSDEDGFSSKMVRRDKAAQSAVEGGQSPDSFRAEAKKAETVATPVAPVGKPAKPVEPPKPNPVDTKKPDTVEDNDSDEADKSDPDEADSDDADEEVEITLDELRSMKKNDLIELAKANKIDSKGTPKELLKRLEAALFSD
jgi:hypothetical protein